MVGTNAAAEGQSLYPQLRVSVLGHQHPKPGNARSTSTAAHKILPCALQGFFMAAYKVYEGSKEFTSPTVAT